MLAVVAFVPAVAAADDSPGLVGDLDQSVEPVSQNGPQGPPGDGDDGVPCPRRCFRHARQMANQCIEDGEPPWVCYRHAWRELGRCLRDCPEEPCRDHCAALGRDVFQQCLDEGNPRPVCVERREQFVLHCLAGCAPLNGFERCHLVAGRIHHDCV
ncbi:MAG TPA: hypothetical protein VM243_13945 [Phycisphaerae bacterium]|nr:hypothetical protein [Phycisphaerae bacterium]